MICKQCGATISDSHQFCPYCGNAMSAPEPPVQESISFDMPQAYQPAEPQFKTCANCGTTMTLDTKFCPVCGRNSSAEPAYSPVTPGYPEEPVKKKKGHGVAITLSVIAGILVIALVAGWLTN